MSEFTPGPWRIGSLESYDAYTGRPYRNVWAGQVDAAHCIARAIEEDGRGLSDVDANARLIAAAPDLLAALEGLIDEQNGPPLVKRESQWQEAMVLARAAIKKARG